MTSSPRWPVLLAHALLLAACGTASAPPPTSSAASEPEPVVEDDPPSDEPLEPAIPQVTDDALDAMERGELEMLCDRGSNAACDRLGH